MNQELYSETNRFEKVCFVAKRVQELAAGSPSKIPENQRHKLPKNVRNINIALLEFDLKLIDIEEIRLQNMGLCQCQLHGGLKQVIQKNDIDQKNNQFTNHEPDHESVYESNHDIEYIHHHNSNPDDYDDYTVDSDPE